ncbi:5375_t:CDS:1, partial [Dentiscutata erythropus]
PSNIPAFLVLINITVKVRQPPTIKDNNAIIVVAFTDYVDQDSFTIEINCHYLASAPHLIQITPTIKKNFILFICGEFISHNNNNYIHVRSMSFLDQQKTLLNLVNIPWKTETSNETMKSQSITERIAARVNANNKSEESPSVSKTSYINKTSSTNNNPNTTVSKNKKNHPQLIKQ